MPALLPVRRAARSLARVLGSAMEGSSAGQFRALQEMPTTPYGYIGAKKREPTFFLVLFCTIATVNYLDRGALNGALTNVKAELCLSTAQEGTVVSAFTVGYIAAAPVFAHLSGTPAFASKSFRLMGFGLLCFSVGSLFSFFAVQTGVPSPAYYLLLLSRALVGVGEAAFLVLAPPFIDRVAPDDKKGLWLSLFYATIPFGMAIGFGLGGYIGGAGHYTLIFLIDALLMAPFVMIAIAAPASWEPPPPSSESAALIEKEPFWMPAQKLMKQGPYVCLAMGYAAYTFTIGGFSVFAPQFLQYVYNMQQGAANLTFGAITAATGLIGTVAGGWLLEQRKSGPKATAAEAAELACLLMLVSLPLCFLAFLVDSQQLFLLLLGLGELIIFAKEGPVNSAMLWSVGDELKPHAMAFSMLLGHLFGDIPSPPILGGMLDATADYTGTYQCVTGFVPDPKQPLPRRCVTAPADGGVDCSGGGGGGGGGCSTNCSASDLVCKKASFLNATACGGTAAFCGSGGCIQVDGKSYHGNYRLVMGVACGWLLWAVLLWGWAGRLLRKRDANLHTGLRQAA